LDKSEILIGAKGTFPAATNGKFCEQTVSGVPNQIQIKIIHPHRIVMPLAGSFLGQQINLSASATSTILQPPCP
jgi:hypothetical protein